MEINEPYISVVVVFHNAENTIGRTLHSLAAQTLDNVEYLFVDDGSTDRSAELLQDFVALHPEFTGKHRLISIGVQRGVGHGTLVGYTNARGRYVIRCDADDYMEPDALEVMWRACGDGKADAVFARYMREEPGKTTVVGFPAEVANLNDMKFDTIHFSLWNKLLRRSMLDDNEIVAFDGVDCWEDLGVVARFMAFKPEVVYIGKPLYHYVASSGQSLSSGNQGRQLEDHLMMALLLEQWLDERNLHDENEEFLTHLKFFAKVKMLRGRDKDVARWKKTFPEVNSRIMRMRHLKWPWRLLFSAVALLPVGFTQWVADCCDMFYPKIKADAVRPRPHDSHPNIPERKDIKK